MPIKMQMIHTHHIPAHYIYNVSRLAYIHIHTYIHTKLYLNHASLNSRWKAACFHEWHEITYLQEINYLQEIQKYNKKNTSDFSCTITHMKQISTHSLFQYRFERA
jgi:hypothetical protein